MESFTVVIGIVASVFTGIALLPQLIKIIREKKGDGVSPLMMASLFIGLAAWMIYGIKKNDWIIIISNGFALCVNSSIAALCFYYKKPR